jgi:formylglycine-generating enzyme required for sulfatase activity
MLDLEALLGGSLAELRRRATELEPPARSAAARALVHVAEDAKRPLDLRHAAGDALGILGDPRIDPLRPALCFVPGGSFAMGMREEEVPAVAREFGLPETWLRKACPLHDASVEAFEIARFPVTQGEWALFVAETGHPERPAFWRGPAPPPGRESHPVWGISWDAVLAYCDWLSSRTALRWRVPSEAEWEKAARGDDGRAYPWGARFDPRRANTRETGLGDTTAVGIFPEGASPCGALDLSGNVEEFVATLHAPYPGAGAQDEEPEQGRYRVTRGGCFALDGDLARCDRRHGTPFATVVGFRLARSRADGAPEREGRAA